MLAVHITTFYFDVDSRSGRLRRLVHQCLDRLVPGGAELDHDRDSSVVELGGITLDAKRRVRAE